MRKINRKRVLIGLVFAQVSLSIILSLPIVFSFKVGNLSGAMVIPCDISQTEIDQYINSHYGTHDWIGDGVINYIIAHENWIGNEGRIFWTERRRMIFLIGTEAPDARVDQLEVTLDKRVVTGMKHNFYARFYDNSWPRSRLKIYNDYGAFSTLNTWDTRVESALRRGKCDLAAFYMGAICHGIADYCQWTHLIEGGPVYHEYYEREVNKVTNTRRNQAVFRYSTTSTTGVMLSASVAAYTAAFQVRWHYPARYNEIITTPTPSYIQPDPNFSTDKILEAFEGLAGPVTSWPDWLKGQVQFHLWRAIDFSIQAIRGFRSEWNGNCLSCDEQNSNSRTPQKSITSYLGMMMCWIMTIGIANTILMPLLTVFLEAIARAK